MSDLIKRPKEMNFSSNISYWDTWKQHFHIFLDAIVEVSEKRKIAILLNSIGEGLKIYNSFKLPNEEITLKKILDKFDNVVSPEKT